MIAISERYRIELLEVPGMCDVTTASEHVGPSDNAGLRFSDRTVVFSRSATVDVVLHEIVHVIAQPPCVEITFMPEDFVLLQFERAIAKAIRDPEILRHVIIYQEGTTVPLICADGGWLGGVFDYTRSRGWRAGFRRARELDLLDDRNRPTWSPANWTPKLLLEAREVAEA